MRRLDNLLIRLGSPVLIRMVNPCLQVHHHPKNWEDPDTFNPVSAHVTYCGQLAIFSEMSHCHHSEAFQLEVGGRCKQQELCSWTVSKLTRTPSGDLSFKASIAGALGGPAC